MRNLIITLATMAFAVSAHAECPTGLSPQNSIIKDVGICATAQPALSPGPSALHYTLPSREFDRSCQLAVESLPIRMRVEVASVCATDTYPAPLTNGGSVVIRRRH